MAVLDEATNAATPANTLLAGLRILSDGAAIRFTQYVRQVLPLDGYVFWVKTQQTTVQGSLHYPADTQQREDETISISRVVFTTDAEIADLAKMAPDTIWIGEFADLKFAFSQRAPYYRSANLYHYSGDAVYPAMETQLVDIGTLSSKELIVSNSLPAWLTLKTYAPPWLIAGNPGLTLYPSFAVPDNLVPPYGAVHIIPEETRPIAEVPYIGVRGGHTQLACDRVKLTLYGLDNTKAQAFLDLVLQYSLDTDIIGMMDVGIVRDEKRTQSELNILAQKKTLEFEVSYLQSAMPNVARQLIKSVPVTYILQ